MSDIAIEIQEFGVDTYGLVKTVTKCQKECGRKLYNADSKRLGICRSCRGLNKRVIYGEGRDDNLTGNPEFAR